MIPTPPTANVLNPLLWLGCHVDDELVSTGSGVVINADGAEYLATALHVIEDYGPNPRVRSHGKWQAIDWQTVAIDRRNDLAVLKTNTVLDLHRIPVKYGETAGLEAPIPLGRPPKSTEKLRRGFAPAKKDAG